MPLTTERPGVFRGTRNDRTAWYVVSPALGNDTVSAWRDNYAPTNRPRWQRIIRGVLGWSAFIVALGVVAFLSGLASTASTVLMGFVIFIGLIGSVVVGVWATSAVFRDRPPLDPHMAGVVELRSEITEWADESVERADLWELAVAVSRVEQVAQRFWWATEEAREPSLEVVEDRVTPVLDAQFEEEAAKLIAVADRLRFTVPDEVWDREPRDE